jgi:hypothetical protein
MTPILVRLAWALVLASLSALARAERITAAHYLEPTSRYGHFALGRPHEYARLVATTDSGRQLDLQLPDDEVFEDLAPRLVQRAPGEPVELLAIVSRRHDGARLVLLQQRGDRLVISAETPSVGTPMRWLNPVGVADLDGDGRAEVAMVTTPHLGGVLRVFRQEGRQLVEVARQSGFSNHVYGATELGLSTPAVFQGRMRLFVPDVGRRHLRIMGLQGERLVEVGRCALPAIVTGAIEVVSATELTIGLGNGRHVVRLDTCSVD